MEPVKIIKKIYVTPISAFDIAERLQSGEAQKVGKRAEKGHKQAMSVIATYVLWQRFLSEKTQTDFEQAYIKYKNKVKERIV